MEESEAQAPRFLEDEPAMEREYGTFAESGIPRTEETLAGLRIAIVLIRYVMLERHRYPDLRSKIGQHLYEHPDVRDDYIRFGIVGAERMLCELARKVRVGQAPTAIDCLKSFVETVHNTGGVVQTPAGHYEPEADRDWLDIGYAYVEGAALLREAGVWDEEPKITVEDGDPE